MDGAVGDIGVYQALPLRIVVILGDVMDTFVAGSDRQLVVFEREVVGQVFGLKDHLPQFGITAQTLVLVKDLVEFAG